jgi:hypothetical protein
MARTYLDGRGWDVYGAFTGICRHTEASRFDRDKLRATRTTPTRTGVTVRLGVDYARLARVVTNMENSRFFGAGRKRPASGKLVREAIGV